MILTFLQALRPLPVQTGMLAISWYILNPYPMGHIAKQIQQKSVYMIEPT